MIKHVPEERKRLASCYLLRMLQRAHPLTVSFGARPQSLKTSATISAGSAQAKQRTCSKVLEG